MSFVTTSAFKPIRKARKSPERDLQIACVEYLQFQYGERLFYFHSPNGGKRNKIEAELFRRMGVLKGLPDLVFLTPIHFQGKAYAGTVIELKAKGNKVEKGGDQELCMKRLEKLGFLCMALDSVDQFVKVVVSLYGHLKFGKN